MKIGIIGFGNLGRALAAGLIKSNCAGPGDIFVCESAPEVRLFAEREPYFAQASEEVNYVISEAEVIFLIVHLAVRVRSSNPRLRLMRIQLI